MAKVLLVEDDNNLREIFEARLQADGYETVTAGNGEEGLTVAMREKPDLIIADVMMPKLSGFEMLETLRAAPDMKDTKVIMMTALGQAEDQARGESLGVVRYLVKSQATLEDFARVVSEVLPPGHGQTEKPGSQQQSSQNNKEERQDDMQEDPNTTNPTPADDGAGTDAGSTPASNPVEGGATPAPSTDGQQTTADEQAGVQSQIDSFASAPAPAAPAADSGTPAPAADSTTPPPADQGSFAPATPPADAPAADPAAPTQPENSGDQAAPAA